MTDASRTIWVGRHGTSDRLTGCIRRTMTLSEPYHHDAVVRELMEAAAAVAEHALFHDREYLSAELSAKLDDLRAPLAKIAQENPHD